MNVNVRLSTDSDKNAIEKLMTICFCKRDYENVMEESNSLNGRFLLAFEDKKLIGMTGLYYNQEYKAYELDWTCTHPDYRRNGVMTELFRRICALTDEDIYCSCWRLPGKEANLLKIMKRFGFEEVVKCRISLDSRYNCKAGESCVETEDRFCRCYEDLWLRREID